MWALGVDAVIEQAEGCEVLRLEWWGGEGELAEAAADLVLSESDVGGLNGV
jgi:hypothetical protein